MRLQSSDERAAIDLLIVKISRESKPSDLSRAIIGAMRLSTTLWRRGDRRPEGGFYYRRETDHRKGSDPPKTR